MKKIIIFLFAVIVINIFGEEKFKIEDFYTMEEGFVFYFEGSTDAEKISIIRIQASIMAWIFFTLSSNIHYLVLFFFKNNNFITFAAIIIIIIIRNKRSYIYEKGIVIVCMLRKYMPFSRC